MEQRLADLERGLGRWRAVTLLLVLVLIVGATVAGTDDTRKGIVQCAAVQVWHRDKLVAELTGCKSGGLLRILNSSSRLCAVVGGQADGTGTLATYSDTGKELVKLTHGGGGHGAVGIFCSDGTEGVRLQGADSGGLLGIKNSAGLDVVQILSSKHGNGHVEVCRRKKKGVVVIGSDPDRDIGGYLAVRNRTDDTVVTLRADEYGHGIVEAWNNRGDKTTLTPRH